MLSTGEDVNVLVLDTEEYSNTGGQKVGCGCTSVVVLDVFKGGSAAAGTPRALQHRRPEGGAGLKCSVMAAASVHQFDASPAPAALIQTAHPPTPPSRPLRPQSKASPLGAVVQFAAGGKTRPKKELALMMMQV